MQIWDETRIGVSLYREEIETGYDELNSQVVWRTIGGKNV